MEAVGYPSFCPIQLQVTGRVQPHYSLVAEHICREVVLMIKTLASELVSGGELPHSRQYVYQR